MASPLYRQEQQWARRGVAISRQNMANWVIYAAENWLKPVYDCMQAELMGQNIIAADETSLQVLKEEGKKPNPSPTGGFIATGRAVCSMNISRQN